MSEVFGLLASHPVAVVASILSMAIWATVVWVGRALMRQVNTGTAALVAIPVALRAENEATRNKVEAEHDKTRGRIHNQDKELAAWRRKQEVDTGIVLTKLNGKR